MDQQKSNNVPQDNQIMFNQQKNKLENLNQYYQKVVLRTNKQISSQSINLQKSIFLTGCKQIKLYSFTNQFKLFQKFSLPSRYPVRHINQIIFLKNINSFIAKSLNSYDCSSICIWQQTQYQQWQIQYIIEMDSYIQQILVNKNEDLLISLDEFEEIKFLSKNLNWKCEQTIKFEEQNLTVLSMNDSEEQLICGAECKIFVLEKNLNHKWYVKETLSFYSEIQNLFYIKDNIFLCKIWNDVSIDLFKQDSNLKKYIMQQQIKILSNVQEYRFQLEKCINQKLVMLAIKGYQIDILKFDNYESFSLISSLKFESKPKIVVKNCLEDYLIIQFFDNTLQILKQKQNQPK